MKHLILTGLILLTGCSVDNPTQHSYASEQYDAETGITLLPSDEMWISFERVVSLHKEMQECLGLAINPEADKTIIAWRSFENADGWWKGVPLGAGFGFHIVIDGTSHIYVNTDLDKEPYIYQGFDRDEYTDVQTTKHEFIHSISYHTGADIRHGDTFTRCDAWVNTYN